MPRKNTQAIAQSFSVTTPVGIFLTDIDLYFSTKDDTLPVFLEIRPLENGVPSSGQHFPNSTVSVSSGSVNVSDDASLATNFEFEEPIYLAPGQDYAFVVFSRSGNYNLYIAEIGEFVLNSTEQRIKTQPYSGSLFLTQNSATWTPVQEVDLKFKMNVALFRSWLDTKASFGNADVPLYLLPPDPITVDSGSDTVTVAHPDHGFVVGDPVVIRGVDSADTIGGVLGTSILGQRTITAADYTGYQFTADSAGTSNEIGGGSAVTATRNIMFDAMLPNVEALVPPNSYVEYAANFTSGKSYAGSETAYQKVTGASGFENFYNKQGTALETRKVIANPAIELAELGSGVNSLDVEATFTSLNNYVAPYIDMQRTAFLMQSNVIDNQDSAASSGYNVPLSFVSETDPLEGSQAAKHITKTVTLEEDAVGLKVILSANRPPESSFKVYYKTGLDETNMDTVNWALATQERTIPADDDPLKFRDYEYLIGGEGGTLDAFTKFKIKIVMTTTNNAKIPRFRDMRAIALSV
jgi:hypothetical protein